MGTVFHLANGEVVTSETDRPDSIVAEYGRMQEEGKEVSIGGVKVVKVVSNGDTIYLV